MKRVRSIDGFSMVIVLTFLLLLVPLALLTLNIVTHSVRFSVFDRHERTAWESANSALMDYMRQFGQSQNGNYLEPAALARPNLSLGGGVVSYNPSVNIINRSAFLEAQGKFGLNPNDPGGQQRFTALVRFQSDLTRYAIMYGQSIPWNDNGASSTHYGPVFIKGDITSVPATAPGQVIEGGPVVVTGNISLDTDLEINGDFYLGGTKSGIGDIIGTGGRFNYVPTVEYPTLDRNYYEVFSSFTFTQYGFLRFNGDGTFKFCQSPNPNVNSRSELVIAYNACVPQWVSLPSVSIPATGAIFYAKNTNISVYGEVDRPVTVVALGAPGVSYQGCIEMPLSITYPAGATSATSSYSFAALAQNYLFFDNINDATSFEYRGVAFSSLGYDVAHFRSNPGATMHYYGTFGAGGVVYGNLVMDMHFDAMLNRYPPPGLPERPLLVNWNMK